MIRRLAGAAAAVMVLAGCGLFDADESANNPVESSTTVPDSGTNGPLKWAPCHNGLSCARLQVPLDYADPTGQRIKITVARRPASDSSKRVGALFVNPGGPGGDVLSFVQYLPLPAEITDRFDIVGVQPRGLEGSTPLDCHFKASDLYRADPTMEDQADVDAYLDVSERYVQACDATGHALLAHLGTRDVVRDMERVRRRMGDDKLSYLGYSYGTSIGQIYADLFPEHVRAMALDGVVDLATSGIESAAFQATGFERAMKSFARDCDAKDCPLAPNTIDRVHELIDRVESKSIPSTSGRPLGPGELSLGFVYPLYSDSLWSELADAVDEALDGDGARMVRLADAYFEASSTDIYFAVECLDQKWPRNTTKFFVSAKAAGRSASIFGEATVNDYLRCALWPVKSKPLAPTTAPKAPPIVVVSTTKDPATPYESGVLTAKRLRRGVLITHRGDGHGVAYDGTSDCVDSALTTYFVDLRPPVDGLVC